MRRFLVLLAPLFVIAGIAFAAPAQAAPGDRIPLYDVRVTVASDATLSVTETIQYTFGGSDRHGIYRSIPVVNGYDETYDRVIEINNLQVTSPTGAPTQTKTSREGHDEVIRIGDPDRTVRGTQTYVISYQVVGAMNAFPDHAELYWNATGNGWDAPIDVVRATVNGPTAPTDKACFAGPERSVLPCAVDSVSGSTATFGARGLNAYEGLSFVTAYPPSAVVVPPPILEERFALSKAFSVKPLQLGAAILTLLFGLGVVGYALWARGRDRRYVGQIPGLTPTGQQMAVEKRIPLSDATPVVVDFAPAKGVTPGEVGTLVDERADVLDVTATIVDLAVRGYLRIDEMPEEGRFFKDRDWNLVKLKDADPELKAFEHTLFSALFRGRDQVTLKQLKQTFADDLSKVRTQLYDAVVLNGWFRSRPDITRFGWTGFGLLLAGLGIGITFVLAMFTHFGLVGVACVLSGIALVIGGKYMPARTGKGSAALAQSLGFRQYIRTAEAEQIRFEERESVFSRYLPYAIVFGEADRWAKTFASLSRAGGAVGSGVGANPGLTGLYWYGAMGGFNADAFGASLSAFTVSTAGSIAAAAPSSSGGSGFSSGGGFSGGGFGGGGGGSW